MALSKNSKILASDVSGAIKGLSVSGKIVTYTKLDGTTGTITTQDTNTTYSNMTAATSDAAGKAGLVPAPAKGAQTKFLRGDATWQDVSAVAGSVSEKLNTEIFVATDSTKTQTVTSLTINKPVYIALANTTSNVNFLYMYISSGVAVTATKASHEPAGASAVLWTVAVPTATSMTIVLSNNNSNSGINGKLVIYQ